MSNSSSIKYSTSIIFSRFWWHWELLIHQEQPSASRHATTTITPTSEITFTEHDEFSDIKLHPMQFQPPTLHHIHNLKRIRCNPALTVPANYQPGLSIWQCHLSECCWYKDIRIKSANSTPSSLAINKQKLVSANDAITKHPKLWCTVAIKLKQWQWN